MWRSGDSLKARSVKVADGDTVRVQHVPLLGQGRDALPTGTKHKLSDTTIQVRLYGIDTPETAKFGASGQAYGMEAKAALQLLMTSSAHVRVVPIARDRFGRAIASVHARRWPLLGWLSPEVDVSMRMLDLGLAYVYTQEGAEYEGRKADMMRREAAARAGGVGMWGEGDALESPAEYKARIRSEQAAKEATKEANNEAATKNAEAA